MAAISVEETKLAGVVGWPAAHSLSPVIHSTWAAREGAPARYNALAVEPTDEAFCKRINELRAQGYVGVNVTIPHKERALKIADRASDAALAIGAANMLTFSGGKIFAENSDATAAEAIIRELTPFPGTALVLGAGGAARGVLYAMKRAGVRRILLSNRTKRRATEIADVGAAQVVDWTRRAAAASEADLVVNATSLGMNGAPPLDLDVQPLKQSAVIFDIVYAPLETPLLRAARARGLKTIDGLEMLMRQAVPGYLRWLGTRAEVDEDLRARLEAALMSGSA